MRAIARHLGGRPVSTRSAARYSSIVRLCTIPRKRSGRMRSVASSVCANQCWRRARRAISTCMTSWYILAGRPTENLQSPTAMLADAVLILSIARRFMQAANARSLFTRINAWPIDQKILSSARYRATGRATLSKARTIARWSACWLNAKPASGVLCKMDDCTSDDALAGFTRQMKKLPAFLRKSTTYDPGSEMACCASSCQKRLTYSLPVKLCPTTSPACPMADHGKH